MSIEDVIAGKRQWWVETGDCREVLPSMPGDSVSAIVCDPPYGIINKFGEIHTRKGYGDGRANGTRKLQFAWDTPDVREKVSEAIRLACAVCMRSAAIWMFCGFDHASMWAEVARNRGFSVKPAAWMKEYPAPAGHGNWWPSAFELAFYGYRNSPWFGDGAVDRCNVFWSDSYRHGMPGKVNHPTQKPLGLMGKLVSAIVPPGGICLDMFAGSGSTGVACLQTGRRFIGIEIDPTYADIARRRIANAMPLFAAPPVAEQPGLFDGV